MITPQNKYKLMPKILIGCPTNSVKDYAFLDWLGHIRLIDYPKDRFDVMMVDNSRENSYEKYIKSWGIITRRIHPKNRNPIEFICDSHNTIREYFLENEYDYLLHLESDVNIKTQTLRTLLFYSQRFNLPIVNASYFHGNDERTTNLICMIENTGNHRHEQKLGFKQCISNSNKLMKVYACGLGCCLIRRDVFNSYNIKFRYKTEKIIHPDSFFYEDLYRNNIPVYLDTSIILEHNSKNWNHNLDTLTIQPTLK